MRLKSEGLAICADMAIRDGALAALTGSMRDFRHLPGANLLNRIDPFFEWQQLRRVNGVWPFGRSAETGPRSRCSIRTDDGALSEGVNFGSQDYLSLSVHPAIRDAAVETIKRFGVHSAGSPALVGNTSLSLALEKAVAAFLEMEHVVLFPTGWAAGFGVIKGLVRPSDHIVMDRLSHACLREGAQAATRNIQTFRHNDIESARQKLRAIRAKDTVNGVLVITESLFSMDSDTPDILSLQALAQEFGATLVVDVAHDLGCVGPRGRGHVGAQSMVGKVDVLMGSFSKTFASNGGFVACNRRAVTEYLKYYASPCTFSNALSPVQSATILQAFAIVDSPEGDELRDKLMTNIRLLRDLLHAAEFETYGGPSPIVCVRMASEALARLAARRLHPLGLLVNLVEFPAVPKSQPRFRLQVMSAHTHGDIASAVHCLDVARREATAQVEALRQR